MSKKPPSNQTPDFEYVESSVRRKTFGVLTTVDKAGTPHSTGILYGVAPPTSPFALYVLTLEKYIKIRNVRANPRASLVVPFPHRILSFIPAPCATFRGLAEVVPFDDADGRWAFKQQRILRDNAAWLADAEPVFLKLTPEPTVLCHGLGIGLMRMRREHTAGGYRVQVPARKTPGEPASASSEMAKGGHQ